MKNSFNELYQIFYGRNLSSDKTKILATQRGLENPPASVHDHTIVFSKIKNDIPIRHRLDGPAVLRKDGDTIWFVNGRFIDHLIKSWAKENDINLDNLSDEDKILIKLVWAECGKSN